MNDASLRPIRRVDIIGADTIARMTTSPYTIGQRVRVTQQVPKLGNAGETIAGVVEGVVVGFSQAKTGSWYAHSKDKKLWLDRLQLRKDDGEVVFVNLDQFSSVEVVDSVHQ